MLHQHLDITVKKKRRTVFSSNGGKTRPAAPNAFDPAIVCNDASERTAASSVCLACPGDLRKTPTRHPAVQQRPVLPVSASRANYGVIAAQGAPSAPAPPHTRPAPAAHAASSDPDDSRRVERLPLHARSASWGGQWLCRYAVAPLPRTASSANSSTCAFSKARKASADRAPAPSKKTPRSQTRAFLPLRASVRCRKDREGFSESGRDRPPSTNVFRRAGHSSCGPLARTVEDVFPHAQDGQLIERRLIRCLPRARSYSSVRSQDEPVFPEGATPHSATFPFFLPPCS